MKKLFFILIVLQSSAPVFSQPTSNAQQFWNTLRKHCGNAYEGTLADVSGNDSFSGKKLIMHVRSCDDYTIRIPFLVGDDRSRTWVLQLQDEKITLKHDHRHEDGSEDTTTQYGGTASNSGLPGIQVFPADAFTASLIPAASTNVWWITLSDTVFTYNLRRIGTDRIFTVSFDLTKRQPMPPAP